MKHIIFYVQCLTSGFWYILSYSVYFLFIAERVGVNVVECACVIELPELKVQPYLDVWLNLFLTHVILFKAFNFIFFNS